jgi:putative glutamine amidotransferase
VVVVPGRFSAGASALRYRAVVNARALLEMVHAAGGEPVTALPWPDSSELTAAQVGERLAFADAVLLPGGGDVDPQTYGEVIASDDVYDVDAVQDHADLAIAEWALDVGLPLLAICRGLHVVNVSLGGTLEQHMAQPHRERVHQVVGAGPWPAGVVMPAAFDVSCYHHQRVAQLAAPLEAVCWADDGTVEAATFPSAPGWFLGVQWHPEDTPHQPEQFSLLQAFVAAAAR